MVRAPNSPSVEAATIALKMSQKQLTDLRRKHLEAEYIPASEVRGIVVGLAEELKAIMKRLPAEIAPQIPQTRHCRDRTAIFDFYSQHVCEAAEAAIAKLSIKPSRARTSTYTTKPGPKPRKASA